MKDDKIIPLSRAGFISDKNQEYYDLQIKIQNKMKQKQFFSYKYIDSNTILIYKQKQESKNSFECVSQIVLQLLKENKDHKFIVN